MLDSSPSNPGVLGFGAVHPLIKIQISIENERHIDRRHLRWCYRVSDLLGHNRSVHNIVVTFSFRHHCELVRFDAGFDHVGLRSGFLPKVMLPEI